MKEAFKWGFGLTLGAIFGEWTARVVAGTMRTVLLVIGTILFIWMAVATGIVR